MKKLNTNSDQRERRKGAVAMITALLLMAVLGLVACALDIGWIEMTRTQLQSAADASALAAGTELLPGFGYKKTKTTAQIEAAAKPVAVEYAGYNRNAELDSTLVDENRDIEFGQATYDDDCSCWIKTPESESPPYYNYVEVSALRNQAGSTAGDGPAPLFFARILGMADKSLLATSTAAQLQANGFRVPPGSDDTVDMIPFAVAKRTWKKMERAQAYYNTHPNVFANTTNPFASNYYGRINDLPPPAGTGEPLFGRRRGSIFGLPIVEQEFFDDYTRTDAGVVTGPTVRDGKLELNIIDWESAIGDTWNFGTIHVGANSHPWNYISSQIRNGISENDFSHYDNNQFTASVADPMTFDAHIDLLDIFFNTSVSTAFQSVRGKCRAIALYSSVSGTLNPEYTVDEFVAANVVRVQTLIGNFIITGIRMQPCKLVENNALPDTERPIDDNSTIFTPITLIR